MMYLEYNFLIILCPLIMLHSHDVLLLSGSKLHLPNMHIHTCTSTHSFTHRYIHTPHSLTCDTHSPCTYTHAHYQIQPTSMHNHTDTTHTYQTHITHTYIHTHTHRCTHRHIHAHSARGSHFCVSAGHVQVWSLRDPLGLPSLTDSKLYPRSQELL